MPTLRSSLPPLALAAALLLTGSAAARRRGAGQRGARAIPDSILSKTLPTFGFKRRRADPALLFNVRLKEAGQGASMHTPSVFVSARGGWVVAPLPGDFEQTGWVFAGRAPDRPEVWGVAEIDVEGRGPDLELVSSRDGGLTWRHYTLHKVSRFAEFRSLHMTGRGDGALTVQLSDEDAQNEGTPAVKAGYYTYTTRNGGRTWTKHGRFSATEPAKPPGTLDKYEVSYDDSEPPGPGRLRELMRELNR
jgi:hypothetical protein